MAYNLHIQPAFLVGSHPPGRVALLRSHTLHGEVAQEDRDLQDHTGPWQPRDMAIGLSHYI